MILTVCIGNLTLRILISAVFENLKLSAQRDNNYKWTYVLNLVMGIFHSLKSRYNNLPVNSTMSEQLIVQRFLLLNFAAKQSKNPLSSKFRKYFSQNDEDHITLQILKRLNLNITEHRFIEFGSGNGLENNTIILIALGWKGIWIDSKPLEILLEKNKSVRHEKIWLDLDSLRVLLP